MDRYFFIGEENFLVFDLVGISCVLLVNFLVFTMTRCKVCNKKIHAHKRFGALSCGACGAFFRRSIAERKNYKCYKGNSCEIIESKRLFKMINKVFRQSIQLQSM